MEVLKETKILSAADVKTSGILMLLQNLSAHHCEKYHMSFDELGEQGIIWVVIRQYVKLERELKAGEKIEMSTWPGPTRHMLFPRYYVFRDENGDVIMRGAATWALVNMESRRMIKPEDYNLGLEGIVTGDEIKMPPSSKKSDWTEFAEFTVPEDYLDFNKHMNNTRYYDLSEHCLGDKLKGRHIKEALTDFISEARLGDNIDVRWKIEEDGKILISGEHEGPVFRMSLRYF